MADIQEHHVGALLKPHELPDHEISKRSEHSAHTQGALADLLARPSFTYADVLRTLTGMADKGMMSQADALHLASKLPSDAAGLRQAVGHFHEIAGHAGRMLATEKARRAPGVGV